MRESITWQIIEDLILMRTLVEFVYKDIETTVQQLILKTIKPQTYKLSISEGN